MTHHLITEGLSDIKILEAIIGVKHLRTSRIAIHPGGGGSSAESLARSILAVRREPVALIVDSDSTDLGMIQDRRTVLSESLGRYAPPDVWTVVLMIPMIESLFFVDPEFLSQLIPNVTEKTILQAKFDPKRALQNLLKRAQCPFERFLTRLADSSPEPLRKTPEIQQVTNFLRIELEDSRMTKTRRRKNTPGSVRGAH